MILWSKEHSLWALGDLSSFLDLNSISLQANFESGDLVYEENFVKNMCAAHLASQKHLRLADGGLCSCDAYHFDVALADEMDACRGGMDAELAILCGELVNVRHGVANRLRKDFEHQEKRRVGLLIR